MALFGKKAMTVEDILEAINTLSDEDKAKVLEEAIDKKSEAEEPTETEAEVEEAKEEIEDKEEGSEPAEEPAEESPVEETHEEEPQAEAERAEETAHDVPKDDERVIALESEVSNLKDLISKIMAQLEDQPFGAQHTLPPVDENNGKWEGPATRAYFGRK